jgi:hypothetical protein
MTHLLRRGTACLAMLLAGCEGSVLPPGWDDDDPPVVGEGPAPVSRFPRLTHTQWENTVEQLLRLDAPPDMTFRTDPALAGFLFDTNGGALEVDDVLWGEYQRAAASLAEQVTANTAMLDRLMPGGARDANAFVRDFGMRAHRRPLTEDEASAYMAIFTAGQTLYDGVEPFVAGVRLVIEAVLQSPFFIYRVESSTGRAGGLVPLDDYEIATRLSYALWNTMPDDQLFAAAQAGELHTEAQVGAHAMRMLDDPKATAVVYRFHSMLLDLEKYSHIMPSRTEFPDLPGDLDRMAAEENRLFVTDLFESDRGYLDVLTSSETFVNGDLAGIYGLEGDFGADFERATLDPSERSGVFTQIGFLAANSTSVSPDPIHRGAYLAKRIACIPIGVPPGEIPPLPSPMGRTNRETVASHTETEGTVCATCHKTIINPFGFAFEGYDAIGAYRLEDAGQPVDSSASPSIGGVAVPVDGAVDLASALAESAVVHECYAEHWIEFTYGRPLAENDAALAVRLGTASLEGGSIKSIVLGLVTSRAFLTRTIAEE